MTDRRLTALALLAAAGVAGCGDDFEKGAGIYTGTTAGAQTVAAPTLTSTVPAVPLQSTDAGVGESSEAPPLTPAQRRDVATAKAAARVFLRGYLPYSYGRADGRQIRAAGPTLKAELVRRPPRVPATIRSSRPVLKRLQLSGRDSGVVFLLAHVDDGRSTYAALVEVRDRAGRWLVTRVQ